MEAYFVDVGILLDEADEEYKMYNSVYDKKHGFYDEEQCYFKERARAIKFAKNYALNGVNNTYAVVSTTRVPADFDFVDQELRGERYDVDSVIYSVAKINGNPVEDFVEKEGEK